MQSQVYVGPLVDAVLAGLEKRYGGVLAFDNSSEANDMILSSVTHPFFKLRWVPGDKIDNVRQRFLQAVSIASISLELQQLDKSDEPVDTLACEDFFVFNNSSKNNAQQVRETGTIEALSYLEEGETKLKVLQKYPLVQALFKKI